MTTRRKTAWVIIVLCVVGLGPDTVVARDTKYMLPIADALDLPAAKDKLDGSVRFYFGKQPHPRVVKRIGEYVSNRKTNAFNKTDRVACEWVFLSSLLALRDRALEEGGNAVIDIRSYYRKNEVVSDTQYECHAGALVAGVTLKGTVVKLAE